MEDRDGMVESLTVAAEDLDSPVGFQGGAEEDILEERLVDVIGAGAGQEKRSLRHF